MTGELFARDSRSRRIQRHRQRAFQNRAATRDARDARAHRRHGRMGVRVSRSHLGDGLGRRPSRGHGPRGTRPALVARCRKSPWPARSDSALADRQGEARDLRGHAGTGEKARQNCHALEKPCPRGRLDGHGPPSTIEGPSGPATRRPNWRSHEEPYNCTREPHERSEPHGRRRSREKSLGERRQFRQCARCRDAGGRGVARRTSKAGWALGCPRGKQRVHGGAVVSRALVSGARRPSAAQTSRAIAAQDAASRWFLADLSQRAQRRHQHHRRSLRGLALDGPFGRRARTRARACVDPVERRLGKGARLHALLAGAARRMAVGEDAESAAGGDLVPAVVSVLDLQFRAMGARHAGADRNPLRASSEQALACRSPPRRAVSRRPRAFRLQLAGQSERGILGRLLPQHGQDSACAANSRRKTGAEPVAQSVHQSDARMDHQAPGRGRRMGWHSAAVDLQPDGVEDGRLRARPSCGGERPRLSQRSWLARGRRRCDVDSGDQQPCLGHDADAARLRRCGARG